MRIMQLHVLNNVLETITFAVYVLVCIWRLVAPLVLSIALNEDKLIPTYLHAWIPVVTAKLLSCVLLRLVMLR